MFWNKKPAKAKAPQRRKPKPDNSLADIKAGMTVLNDKLDAIGGAVKDIHEQTTPSVPWIPSIAISAILVYPVQATVLETAKDHKVSAWLSGYILDAKKFTSDQGLKWGIKTAGGTTSFVAPLKRNLVVTSHYNPRRKHPVSGKIKAHNGTDYRCAIGDPVYSMLSGVVKHAKMTGAAGNMVVVEHATGEKSLYMHLNSISVRYGEKLATGEKLGTCGTTGTSTAPHLHVAIKNTKNTYVNPIHYVGIDRSEDMWIYFKNTVAQSESQGSGGYKALSKGSGRFMGRYQMDLDTIKYAGYPNVTRQKFLFSPDLQDKVYKSWQAKNLKVFMNGRRICEAQYSDTIYRAFTLQACNKKKGKWIYYPGFINDNTPAYKVAGALHAAQFGPIHALRWYAQGREFKDGNNVKISKYARLGETAFIAKYGKYASAKKMIKSIGSGE